MLPIASRRLSQCAAVLLSSSPAASPGLISVQKLQWQPVVGLEVHAQITCRSKLFSAACSEFAACANTRVDLFDAALPGTLPVLNRRCVEAAIMTAHALNMHVNPVSYFDRKHYFYADLPLGYQITQKRCPLARGGYVTAPLNTSNVQVDIEQLQLEIDSGKSYHDATNDRSLIDLNRCGVALMEIVFAPQLSSGQQASAVVRELILLLNTIGTCNCNMSEGALRVDANVSVRRKDPTAPPGVRTEVKNMNSVRSVARAVDYEIARQISLLNNGEQVVSETRYFDRANQATVPLRDKETVQDYRYFPETNLPPLRLSTAAHPLPHVPDIDQLREKLPELPAALRERLVSQYGLTSLAAWIMVNERGMSDYFEMVMALVDENESKKIWDFLRQHFLSVLNENKVDFTRCEITCQQAVEVYKLLKTEQLHSSWELEMLRKLWKQPDSDPRQVMIDNYWQVIVDRTLISEIVRQTLDDNAKLVQKYIARGSIRKRSECFSRLFFAANSKLNFCGQIPILSKLLRRELRQIESADTTSDHGGGS